MIYILNIFIAAFIGGLIKGLVSISKEIRSSPTKKKKLTKEYILITLFSNGGLGLLVGVFIADDIRFALLAGYAGSDFLESLYKIKMKRVDW